MRKRWKNKQKLIIVAIFFLALFGIYYFRIMLPVIKTYSAQQTEAITERAINQAVSNVINRTLRYDTLIDINYASTGEIASFSANQYEINTITREIVKETQYQMTNISKHGLKLNMGTFTGIPFFIGKGPSINLNLIPIGVVGSKFESEFSSVGINMTKHTLYLYIDVNVNIVLPIQTYNIDSTNQILLAESIIVGKVPEVYLNGGSLGKSLNLIP